MGGKSLTPTQQLGNPLPRFRTANIRMAPKKCGASTQFLPQKLQCLTKPQVRAPQEGDEACENEAYGDGRDHRTRGSCEVFRLLRACASFDAVAQYARTRDIPRRTSGRAMQGRLAQRERRCLTSTRSQVQILYRPPELPKAAKAAFVFAAVGTPATPPCCRRGRTPAGFELQVHWCGTLGVPAPAANVKIKGGKRWCSAYRLFVLT